MKEEPRVAPIRVLALLVLPAVVAGAGAQGGQSPVRLIRNAATADAMARVDPATAEFADALAATLKMIEATLNARLVLNSVYFPTALPSESNPNGGLLPSQQRILTELAAGFKKYIELRPDAPLILETHADQRGGQRYNQALSERRANRIRNFLIEEGVPGAHLETRAFGSVRNLDEAAVRRLTEQNTSLSPEARKNIVRIMRWIVLANNRRCDVVLSTTGQQSTRLYPVQRSGHERARGRGGPGEETAGSYPCSPLLNCVEQF